jgi:hypothetical protein
MHKIQGITAPWLRWPGAGRRGEQRPASSAGSTGTTAPRRDNTSVPLFYGSHASFPVASRCRFRVMAPSSGAHLSTGELPCQWSSFRGEGQ